MLFDRGQIGIWASFPGRGVEHWQQTTHYEIEVRPRNWLTPVALVILREESSYCYELMERLEDLASRR